MNEKSSLLTVIIPCYNVADYLRECLDSLRKQQYTDFKTILIDDGSTDSTGTICDEYAAKDNRFIVIHQDNRGSSAARETGLRHAETEYVTFVDGDDILLPNMYGLMMNSLLADNKVDIAMCGVADMWNKKIFYRHTDKITTVCETVGHVEGVLKILDDEEWKSYMWNKIFRRTLFSGIVFPYGRNLDEDLSLMHLLFHKSKFTVYNPSELYIYRHREGSNCLSFSVESMAKKSFDRLAARWERLQFVEEHPEYNSALNKQRNIYLAVGLSAMRVVGKYPHLFPKNYFKENRMRIKGIKLHSYMAGYFNYRKRVELFVLKNIPVVFRMVYKILPAW